MEDSSLNYKCRDLTHLSQCKYASRHYRVNDINYNNTYSESGNTLNFYVDVSNETVNQFGDI